MKVTLVESPPRTIMEVYKKLPEGTRAELIENVIYMSPSPIFEHQDVLLEISLQLRDHLKRNELGKVVIAPFDIYLDEESNAVQPDIVVILKGNEGLDKTGYFHGVPDLIIEILSSGNKNDDLIKKKELYERFGVKEYWVIDPMNKRARGFQLKMGKYNSISDQTGKIASPLLTTIIAF